MLISEDGGAPDPGEPREPEEYEEHEEHESELRHGWVSQAGVIAVVGALLGIGIGFGAAHLLHFGGPDSSSSAATTSKSTASSKSTSSKTHASSKPTSKATTASPSSSATTTTARTAPVAVCNAGYVAGLATTYGTKARSAGWSVPVITNCRGVASANTVFYPQQYAAQAQQLAKDLGISNVSPALSSMSGSRLTLAVLTSG